MKGRGEGRRFQKGHAAVSDGRPVDDLSKDPNRYDLALFLHFVAKGHTPEKAGKIMTVREGEVALVILPDGLRSLLPHGKELVWYFRPPTPRAPSTFAIGGRKIIRKVQRYQQRDPKAALWLQTMAEVISLATKATTTHDKAVIFELCEKVGEVDFYTSNLAPAIDARSVESVRKAIAGI
jgi:hypothetical protein